jgi:diguanylate cyclase (GGDEF)-like protein
MNRNKGPADRHRHWQKNPGRQKDTLSDGPGENSRNGQAAGMSDEAAMQNREQSVAAREKKADSRDQRIQANKTGKGDVERQISRLRAANENLVIATIQAQIRSEEMQRANENISHLAQHDFLTSLPNRVLLYDRITQAIALAKRNGTQIAVMFLDLDNFKHINDTLGHDAGDKLLQSVAMRLSACVRASDTISRLGGDEFVVVVTEDWFAENAALTANKILAALAEPHSIAGHGFRVTPSIGISIYPMDGEDADTLINNADTAMYHIKKTGRNKYQFFEQGMSVHAVERQIVEGHLRQALDRQEFMLHYQAKVNLDSGTITGSEALLRWTHPEWGEVLPEHFMSVAEECGLIVPIGRWVLREACLQFRRWDDAGLAPTLMAVNISEQEFRSEDFVEAVRAMLDETGLAPGCLQLEITERVVMRDAVSSTEVLRQLKALGVQLAVDDLGTGYSSLSYLHLFPIDTLKIDRSFVRDIDAANGSGAIASAVIALGASFKQRVVAEGVEQQSQLDFLKARHCDEGQGNFFSRPLVAEEFAALLATGIPEAAFD